MKIKKFVVNPFAVNSYVIYDQTNEAIVIDPGFESIEEKKNFLYFIKQNNLNLSKIICTHFHIDHILGINFIKDKFTIPVYANKKDEIIFDSNLVFAEMYDFDIKKVPEIDFELSENDKIIIGNFYIDVIEVPGHTPGHLAFILQNEKIIFTGDTLFKDTIGRTDLPGGNLDTLLFSIKNKLMNFDSDFLILPGHGNESTIGYERANNPFI